MTFQVLKLHIQNFRGIKDLEWSPEPKINIIIGGGDCGKTTVLDALGFVFSASSNLSLTETDFWNRDSEQGFSIEATISTSDAFDFVSGNRIYWPWSWNGQEAVQPAADGTSESQNAVFKVAVSANSDFEVSWEILQPDGSREHFPAGLRRKIGLIKLSVDDKNDRDLRLVYGSALDRLLSDEGLRSRIGQEISQLPLTDHLGIEAKAALEALDVRLKAEHLPSALSIGITGGQGISIGALIGLLAQNGDVSLPLSSWGAGTRRMTALQIAAAKTASARITTIDEIERGLEPYRLRQLIQSLATDEGQCFITTHSPIALSSAETAQIWFMDVSRSLGKLDREKISAQQKRDPETFLSKLSVIVEGETEQGFVSEILSPLFNGNPSASGIRVCLGQGDEQVLGLLEALSKSGIVFAGFADNDGASKDRWLKLKTEMGGRLFQWGKGCIETNILGVLPEAYVEHLFKDDDGTWNGYRLRSIAVRLGVENSEKSFETIQAAAKSASRSLIDVISEAARGDDSGASEKDTKKAWKKHGKDWFKQADGSGGRELIKHLKTAGVWNCIEPVLRPFFNELLTLSGKPAVKELKI